MIENSPTTFIEDVVIKSLRNIDTMYRGDKKDLISCLYDIESHVLGYALAFGLEKGIDGLPLVTTCGIVGRKALKGWEDENDTEGDDMETTNTRRFFVGYHLLYSLVEEDLLRFIRRDYPRAPYILIPYADETGLDGLTEEEAEEVIEERRLETKVILRGHISDMHLKVLNKSECPTTEMPADYTGFTHPMAGDLIHNTSDVTKIKVDIAFLGNPKYAEPINKQMKVPMVVNRDLLPFMHASKDDHIYTQKHKKMKPKARESVTDSFDRAIRDAETLDDKTFYEYYHNDYRGRIYSTSSNLNYGSHKLAKSLFYFANHKPLGPQGWNYLLMHTANCWGEDKLTINERIQYVEDRLDTWMMWANDPLKYKGLINRKGRVLKKGWQTADSPWEFLAAIREIKFAIDSGNEYMYSSGLPLAIDCSCSGLQVLTLLTRCHISAPLCNLVKDNTRGDFYTSIADLIFTQKEYSEEEIDELDKVIEEVEAIKSKEGMKQYCIKNGKKLSKLSEQYWDRHYDNRRKLVKRSAMTFLYSCGVEEMGSHIYDDHKTDRSMRGINGIFCFCLAFKIYRACEKLLPGPVSAMEVLMEVAKREHKKNRDFSFKGIFTEFPFLQEYRVDITKVFNVDNLGKKTGLRVKVDEVRIDHESITKLEMKMAERIVSAKDKNHVKNIKKFYKKLIKDRDSETDACCGASPNFVHMLDSQVLSYMIMSCDFNVKTVHDSIACVGADMEEMFHKSREAFRILYDGNILQKMLKSKGYADLIELLNIGEMDNFVMNEFSIS